MTIETRQPRTLLANLDARQNRDRAPMADSGPYSQEPRSEEEPRPYPGPETRVRGEDDLARVGLNSDGPLTKVRGEDDRRGGPLTHTRGEDDLGSETAVRGEDDDNGLMR